ncbi:MULTISPECIES: hypothetical protein [unclassified Pseudoalteromonas]|uniref:hypothetical protein n=1 Tax=unclassified Pseudoalteromonas TaxID=194690 RepID=UPI002096E8AE|nr:hypothetical protein [Pseudoalteromonas sp. XMcav2-N]MCO7191235.1 hypothetical protein [Pseudoalteromonas sp. XMcav2-N]
MHLTIFAPVSVAIASLIPIHSFANGSEEAHVTLFETFGLATQKEGAKYRVVTFIPRTFLLFDIDKEEPDLKVGKQYLAATTQDGVRVFLLEQAVSKGPFKTVYGEQDIIFNKAHSVCFTILCDPQDDDQSLKINAGEVFRAEPLTIAGTEIFKLVGNRGNRNSIDEITGYITKDQLEKLNHKSVVTYATLRHPRYGHTSTEAKSINTSCGQTIKRDDRKKVDNISQVDKTLIAAFGVATIGGGGNLQFKRGYGGPGKEVIYKLYDVVDRRMEPNTQTTYAAQIVYRCDESDIFEKRTFIESVALINTSTNSAYTFKSEGTPENLLDYTGAPYLYSVNNSRHYFQIMDKLSEQFESRALAGYFLAGFNRSCKGKYRKREKICQHSAYEGQTEN